MSAHGFMGYNKRERIKPQLVVITMEAMRDSERDFQSIFI
jgi:hypothetical protein